MSDRLLTAARAYLDHGWPVVPVDGKQPIVRWRPYQDHPPTPTEFEVFPGHRATRARLGRRSGALEPAPPPLDLRGRAGAPPRGRALARRRVFHWRGAGLVCESGAGSLHLYCEATRPVAAARHCWGEVRGAGNLCVLPPSVHPNGIAYRWLVTVEPLLLEPEAVPGTDPNDRLRFDETSGPIPSGERNLTLFASPAGCAGRASPAAKYWPRCMP